jgi:hypothetical protein
MFRRIRPLSGVVALTCIASGWSRAQVSVRSNAPAAGPQAAERYVAEIGADLTSLESHFQKYREAAEKVRELYAKLSARSAEFEKAVHAFATAARGSSQSELLEATKKMQETQMSFNLQYLQLQNQMQNENRAYTAVSNIMKTKHDTAKNSISNVR